MAETMIIFGAGASYGSQTCAVPPLGADLFNQLRGFDAASWGKLDPASQLEFEGHFESGMAELTSKDPQNMLPFQVAMARFLFQFEPSSGNAYIRLAKQLKRRGWRGAVATLNYDRLLQLSLDRANVPASLDRNGIEVCLPHGACYVFGDYAKRLRIEEGGSIRFSSADYGVVGCSVYAVNHRREFEESVRSGLPPVMSLYEEPKRTTVARDWIAGQRDRFKALVLGARRVAIVGLRVHKSDLHIWDPLAETSATLLYCSGNDSKTFMDWAAKTGRLSDQVTGGKFFRDAIDEISDFVCTPA